MRARSELPHRQASPSPTSARDALAEWRGEPSIGCTAQVLASSVGDAAA